MTSQVRQILVVPWVRADVSAPRSSVSRASTPPVEAELLALVAKRDREALARLYDRTRGRVYGLALHIVRDVSVAEEVTLDVYTKVWRDAGRFDPKKSAALSWLLLLTRSRAIDYLRSKAGRARKQEQVWDPARHDGGDGAATPHEAVETAQEARAVRKAVAALDLVKREAIEMAFFAGLTHAEISDRLSVPLGTVKTRIRAGLGELRSAMAAGGTR